MEKTEDQSINISDINYVSDNDININYIDDNDIDDNDIDSMKSDRDKNINDPCANIYKCDIDQNVVNGNFNVTCDFDINYYFKLNGIVQLSEITAESHRIGVDHLCQLNTIIMTLVVICSIAISILSLISSSDSSILCDEKYKVTITIFSCMLTILQGWKHKLKLCDKILIHQQCQLAFLQMSQEVTSNLISVQLFRIHHTDHHYNESEPNIGSNNNDAYSYKNTTIKYPVWISDIYIHMSKEYLRLYVSRPSFDPWFIRPNDLEKKRQMMHHTQFSYS